MKYYTPRWWFHLFDYAIVFNNMEIEFFTDYEENMSRIWDYLKDSDNCRLSGTGWDKQYECYVVDVFCPQFIEFLYHWRKPYISSGEMDWKKFVLGNGWSEEETERGYLEYKQFIDYWFNREYGEHINIYI